MLIKKLGECKQFTANDGCQIQEWLHPKHEPVNLSYSVAMATVDVGKQSCQHKLEQTEVYLIMSGQGCMHIDNNSRQVNEGDAIYIEPGQVQWIENTGSVPLQFIAIVNPPWSEKGDRRI